MAGPIALRADTYQPPANPRTDLLLNEGWKFIRSDVAGAERAKFKENQWANIHLPHTWNNLDGQSGETNYYRGPGWYRLHYNLNADLAGRRLFLKFDGASMVADVFVNGERAGSHEGAFSAFVFDVTKQLHPGAENLIAVRVSNATNSDVPPLSADFTFFGGLYRDVHLLATDPVQISPMDYGSPGVYLQTTDVSSNSANLRATIVLSNSTAGSRQVMLRTVITDAKANIVASMTNETVIAPAAATNVSVFSAIANPHLWNGLADPYLYRAYVEVWRGGRLVDCVDQPLGFRYFRVDANQGFFLNGRHYDLHGVCMHQDWLNDGWAITKAQTESNFALIREMGATSIRLSHYEHSDFTYQLADRLGIVLWSEIPLVNRITESPAFYNCAKLQLKELIRQRYNHPSVVCWGVFNEITMRRGPKPVALVKQLAALAAQEDATRPTTSAANASDDDPSNWCTDINAFNKYFGWYNGKLEDFGPWADKIHEKYPAKCIGISEFGAGASIAQHSEDPVREPANAGRFHPEEYENLYHESQWGQMQSRPWLWCKYVWNMFDFAVAGRREGDTPGRNDKGLVTYDRRVRKDAFYFYQANWSDKPMVYVTGHTFTNRMTNAVTAKVYSNCDSVELSLNGVSQGSRTATNHIFTWPIALAAGKNSIRAEGMKNNRPVVDSLEWIAPNPVATTASLTGAPVTTAANTATNVQLGP